MRIIYLHQYFNTPEMSGSTRSFEVGRRLAAAGHQVDIITSWQEPTERRGWFTTEVAGMRVHWLPVRYSNHMNHLERMGAFIRFAAGAARRARSVPGDVVFASSTPLTIAIPAVYAARRRGIPMVFEVRDLWPELPIAMGALRSPVLRHAAKILERFAYANSAAVIALSPGMAEGIRRTGYPQERIAIVPNASDLELFQRDISRGRAFRARMGIGDDKILVGYVGTLGRINGVSYLVHVAAALKGDPRFVFLTVGDGVERELVAALARTEDVLDRNFLMLSKVAKAQVPDVLSAVAVATSLVVPIPELEANSANKFFDALAAGCCVAVNYGGWHAQLLQETGAGIRLDADPRRAAAALQALADEPGKLESAGRNARRLAEERFSRDELAAKIQAVLASVVGEPP
ncbi:MAG: glycosyltransferase family 4 protein [Steroidobacteraceae bacterium]|jgi:glycosyltransferase involved in cell wall biosynthesis